MPQLLKRSSRPRSRNIGQGEGREGRGGVSKKREGRGGKGRRGKGRGGKGRGGKGKEGREGRDTASPDLQLSLSDATAGRFTVHPVVGDSHVRYANSIWQKIVMHDNNIENSSATCVVPWTKPQLGVYYCWFVCLEHVATEQSSCSQDCDIDSLPFNFI